MSFVWLQSYGNPALAEYARAYERAITSGSIDSAISWELGGFKARDGEVIFDALEQLKAMLAKNPTCAVLLQQVANAVTALRASRDMAGITSHTNRA